MKIWRKRRFYCFLVHYSKLVNYLDNLKSMRYVRARYFSTTLIQLGCDLISKASTPKILDFTFNLTLFDPMDHPQISPSIPVLIRVVF